MDENVKPATNESDKVRAIGLRECPFCRESIRADAIKCRYCGSSLVPPTDKDITPPINQEDGAPGHVTYILDKDLIRFGKVAAAFLSLIVVVGAAFTGLDLKHAVSDANSSAKDASATLDTIKKTEDQVSETKKQMDTEKADVEQQVQAMKQDIEVIQAALPAAQAVAATYKAMTATTTASPSGNSQPSGPSSPQKSFTAPELARLYDFPGKLNGAGQTVGIIELGGGFRLTDLQSYFGKLKLPIPSVATVPVDGGKNTPTNANGPDGQVALDIEICGSVAPRAHLVVYFAPNTDKGFADAVTTAAHDTAHAPNILLIGWGAPEKTWSAAGYHALDDALRDAAVNMHITVIAGAGDGGTADGITGGKRAVDFPASSPWVLAVGGTHLLVQQGKIVSETVWNESIGLSGATGGGVSNLFPQPDWQAKAHIPPFWGSTGRGMPDVAANSDLSSGYSIQVDGKTSVVGGTTAAAALWAGLIALLNQGVGHRLGYINPILYQSIGPAGAFIDIIEGNNSVMGVEGCKAGPGWDYCSGWGSPDGSKLLDAFRKYSP